MPMSSYAPLEELPDDPLRDAVRDELQRLVKAGHRPQDIVVAAFEIATSLAIEVSGIDATSAFLLSVAGKVARNSPEVQRQIGAHIEALGALIERLPVKEDLVRH